jgi:hypothetical protein
VLPSGLRFPPSRQNKSAKYDARLIGVAAKRAAAGRRVQPLSRNTAQGASRIPKADRAASIRGRTRHYIFVFFFAFFFLVAMALLPCCVMNGRQG